MRIFMLIPAIQLFTLGCAHKHPPRQESTIEVQSSQKEDEGVRCIADEACHGDEICLKTRCVTIKNELAAECLNEIHFDYDKSIIRDEDRAHLQRTARCMNVLPDLQVTIAGNTDERGTEEYNLALGEWRAQAVAQYLQYLGVPPSRVHTVTYGKLRPICEAHAEPCWKHNRRVEITRSDLTASR